MPPPNRWIKPMHIVSGHWCCSAPEAVWGRWCTIRLTRRAERQGRGSPREEPRPCLVRGLVQRAVQRIRLLRCYWKCITYPHIFFLFVSLILRIFFSGSISEYVNLMKQELSFAYMFIQHKHEEHLVSDKDTVAKLIKNRDRKPKCRERSSERRLQLSEAWFKTSAIKIPVLIFMHYI